MNKLIQYCVDISDKLVLDLMSFTYDTGFKYVPFSYFDDIRLYKTGARALQRQKGTTRINSKKGYYIFELHCSKKTRLEYKTFVYVVYEKECKLKTYCAPSYTYSTDLFGVLHDKSLANRDKDFMPAETLLLHKTLQEKGII